MISKKIDYLSSFMLEKRWQQLQTVLALRTRYITVCLENIYQPQNASAVLRSCDAFGIQDIHIIEEQNSYKIDPNVAMGSEKWLSLYNYNTPHYKNPTKTALATLKNNGYRIVATTPRADSIALENFDLNKGKVALFFGTELTGLSDEVMEQADEFLHIPMYGFVESFNISVCTSIILYNLSTILRQSDIAWQLTNNEYQATLFNWLMASIRASDKIMDRFVE